MRENRYQRYLSVLSRGLLLVIMAGLPIAATASADDEDTRELKEMFGIHDKAQKTMQCHPDLILDPDSDCDDGPVEDGTQLSFEEFRKKYSPEE